MNEEYLKQIYDYMKLSESGVSFDKFKESISTNEEYNTQVFDYLSRTNPDYKKDKFVEVTGLKKKEEPSASDALAGQLPADKESNSVWDSVKNTWNDFLEREKSYYENYAEAINNPAKNKKKHENYDFAGFDADELVRNVNRKKSQAHDDIVNKVNESEEYLTKLQELIDESEEEGYSDKEKNKKIEELFSEQYSKYFDEYAKTEAKDFVLSNLSEEQKNDKEFMSMLNDKIYFESEIGTDLDGSGSYNNQSIGYDMANSWLIGQESLTQPLMYALSSAFLDGEEKEAFRKQNSERMEAIGERVTVFEKGIASSVGNLDIYNAFHQTMNGLAQTAPIIATTAITGGAGAVGTYGGAALIGVSGGVGAYMEVADDDKYLSNGWKYGYAIANGVGDFAFAAIGGAVFKGASKAAEVSYASARAAAGRKITADVVKGWAARKGIAISSEAAEEAATEVTTYVIETAGRGEKFDMNTALMRGLDAAILGGAAGGVFDYAGSIDGKMVAASRAVSDEAQAAMADVRTAIEQKEAQLREEKDPVSRKKIQKEINRLNAEIDSAAESRRPFYEMLAARHPEAMQRMQELDVNIEAVRSSIKNSEGEVKESLQTGLESLVRQRVELQQQFANEPLQLTKEEARSLTQSRVDSAIKEIDADVAAAKAIVDEYESDGLGTEGFDYDAYEVAKQTYENIKSKRDAIESARKDYADAVEDLDIAIEEGLTEANFMESIEDAILKLESSHAALAETLGVKLSGGVDMVAGEYLAMQQEVQDRATPEWVDGAIENMPNSELSQDQLQAVFDSENFAMLTGENPNAVAVGDKSNSEFNERAKAWLKEKGLKFHEIVGRYGNGENSLLVEGMTREQSAEFAREFRQESVAHKDGLVLQDGSINLFDGGVQDAEGATDYFSAIRDSDGKVKKFGLTPSDTYLDADGNAMDGDAFWNKAAEQKDRIADIVEEAVNEKAESREKSDSDPEVESTQNTEEAGEVKSTTLTPGKDGSYGARSGMAGMSAAEAKAVNRLSAFLSKTLGRDIKVVLYDDSDSSTRAVGDGIGGLWLGQSGEIHISPEAIKKNMAEDETARKKTFQETLLEEVSHGLIGPMFESMSASQQQDVVDKIMRLASKDKALKSRLELKKRVYEQTLAGKENAEGIVREELVVEFISALAGDQGVELATVDKARYIINQILASFYSKLGMTYKLKDANDVLRFAAGLDIAKNNSLNSKVSSGKSGTKASKALSPASLRPKDGKLSVTFSVPFMFQSGRYGNNFGDVTSMKRDVTKTFKDQWHFINWWKRYTDNGSNQMVSNFRTEDGTPIDVNRIPDYKMRRSAALTGGLQAKINTNKDRLKAALDQGVISQVIYNKMMGQIRIAEKRTKGAEVGSPSYGITEQMVDKMEKMSIAMIDKIAKRDGVAFEFEPDTPRGKASMALRRDRLGSKEDRLTAKELVESIREATGLHVKGQAAINSVLADMVREEYGFNTDEWFDMSIDERQKIASPFINKLMSAAYSDGDKRSALFGEKDPLKFFEYNKNATEADLDVMERDGIFLEDRKSNAVAYNIIKAITSQGNLSKRNMSAASIIFYNSAMHRDAGGRGYIDPRIIEDLRNGTSTSGLDLSGIPAKVAKNVAMNLQKLNDFAEIYTNQDGVVNFEAMHKNMKEFRGPKDSSVGREYNAQRVFGNKIGTFALNLNGDEEAITLDSHNLKTLWMFMGMYDSPANEPRFEEYKRRMADAVGMPANPSNPDNNFEVAASHNREVVTLFKETAVEAARNGETAKAEAMFRVLDNALTSKPYSPSAGTPTRKALESAVVSLAKEMEITPAQANQLLFADSQVASNEIKEITGEKKESVRNYQEFSRYSDMNRQNRLWRKQSASLSRQESMRELSRDYDAKIDALYDNQKTPPRSNARINKDDEARASAQLKMPFGNTSQAEESHLYRKRDKEEALLVRPGMVLGDKMVNEALSKDATSRRIINKGIQVSDNQKVGIRLNLNVMKSTGIPVQTMHDRTASGEALRYAPVVTVRNAELFVNQDARRKILTFQENKFPMASVNGGFVSDNISEANFDGVKAFFNPFKHNVFVDAEGRPIKSAEEATIVGNTVYLRGEIEYHDFSDSILNEGRTETAAQREKRVKRGPKYEKALKRYEAYANRQLGITFDSKEELMESYDNMPITSQVAMSESEIAAREEEAQMRASAGLRLRQTAGKAANRYSDIRTNIISNPENYFSRQNLQRVKDGLEMMTDADLVDIMTDDGLGRLQNRNDDMSVLATAELIKRAVGRGDMDAVEGYIAEAAKIGTTAGRLLRHFRELKGSTSEGLYNIVAKAIEARGNKMTPEQDKKLKDMSAELFRLQAEHEELMKRAIMGEDVEAELKNKTDEIRDAERQLDTFSNSMVERGWGTIGKMLIQGNLLTTRSQVMNIGANLINAIGKVGVDIVSLPIEKLIGLLNGEKVQRQYSVGAYMHGMKMFGAGVVEALDEIYTGQTNEVSEWRMHRGFAPFRSLMAAFGKGDLPITQDGESIPVSQRMKLLVQGTFGIPAEVMFRLLSLGDTPFRRYVEGIELYQAGMAQGLEGEALKNFIKHPTKSDRAKAEAEGRKLTYQESTVASKTAEDLVNFMEGLISNGFNWIPGVDGRAVASFLVRSSVPYVRTPANILYDTLTFVTPYVAIPRMMSNLVDGNTREASQNLAKLMIGSTIAQTTMLLIKEGLISGALDWEDDEEKNIAYDQFPPSSINVTGLQRFIKGEDTSHQPDDYFISYNGLGVAGAVMGAIIKGVDKEELKNRDYDTLSSLTYAVKDAFGIGAFSSIAHMMDQSFLQGMNGLVSVISSSDADDFSANFERWFGSMFQAVSATVLPNQLSAMHRAEREYMPDVRTTKDMTPTERIFKRMEYTIKDRTFNTGGLPVRVNWKGEPIKQTPRGTTGIVSQLFDITRARQGEADFVSNEIYRLYESTEDLTKAVGTPGYAEKRSQSVPNPSSKDFKYIRRAGLTFDWMNDSEFMAERVYLNTEQINRMMAASGKQRYADLQQLINSPSYQKMTDQERIEALNEVNDDYNSAIERDGSTFKDHTVEFFKIMQEIYESRE